MHKMVLCLALLAASFQLPGCVALEVVGLVVDTAELIEDVRTGSDAFTRAARSWEGAQISGLISAWGNPDRNWLVNDPARKGWRGYSWYMSKHSDRNYDPMKDDEQWATSLTTCQVSVQVRADGTIDNMKIDDECSSFTPWASRY